MPHESLDAPEDLPKQVLRQVAFGQLEDKTLGMRDQAAAGLEESAALGARCLVALVNASTSKRCPIGKPTCAIANELPQFVEHGRLRAREIPPVRIRELRDLTRHRTVLVQRRANEANLLQKFLETADIKLGTAATDALGAWGWPCSAGRWSSAWQWLQVSDIKAF